MLPEPRTHTTNAGGEKCQKCFPFCIVGVGRSGTRAMSEGRERMRMGPMSRGSRGRGLGRGRGGRGLSRGTANTYGLRRFWHNERDSSRGESASTQENPINLSTGRGDFQAGTYSTLVDNDIDETDRDGLAAPWDQQLPGSSQPMTSRTFTNERKTNSTAGSLGDPAIASIVEALEAAPIHSIKCGVTLAEFYTEKFGSGSKGRCVKFNNNWYTPREFQKKYKQYESTDWKQTISFENIGRRTFRFLLAKGCLKQHAYGCVCAICSDDPSSIEPIQSSEPTQRRRRSQSVCYDLRPGNLRRQSSSYDTGVVGMSSNLTGIPNYCTSPAESIPDGLMTDSGVEFSSIMDPDVSRTSNQLPFQMQISNGVTEETLKGLEAVMEGFASVRERSASVNEDFASGLNTMKSLLEKGRDIQKENQTKIESLQNLIQVGGPPLLYSPEPQFVDMMGPDGEKRRFMLIINNPVTPTVIGGQVRETESPPTLERMEV